MPDYYYHTWQATSETIDLPTSPFTDISTEELLKEHRWNIDEQDRDEIEIEIVFRMMRMYLNGYVKAWSRYGD